MTAYETWNNAKKLRAEIDVLKVKITADAGKRSLTAHADKASRLIEDIVRELETLHERELGD